MKNKAVIALLLLTTYSLQSASANPKMTPQEFDQFLNRITNKLSKMGPDTVSIFGNAIFSTLGTPPFALSNRTESFEAVIIKGNKVKVTWKTPDNTIREIYTYYSDDFSKAIECVHSIKREAYKMMSIYSSKFAQKEVCPECKGALDLVSHK